MARILNGILGPVSGKVGGVVGASWKGSAYIRSYTKPGYSRTDAQAAQRTNMQYLVQAAKPFVGRIFNPYGDKFLNKLSGFNWCIRENMMAKKLSPTVSLLKVTQGPLYPGSITSAVRTANAVAVTFPATLGVDGALTDVAIAWVRNEDTNAVYFSVNGTRNSGSLTVNVTSADDTVDLEAGIFFIRMNAAADVVERISTNVCVEVTDV
jgi:hypothetical protein